MYYWAMVLLLWLCHHVIRVQKERESTVHSESTEEEKQVFGETSFGPWGRSWEWRPEMYWWWPCHLFTQLGEGQCGLRNLPSYFLGIPWCWSAGKQSLICSKQLSWIRFSFQVFLLEMTSGLWGEKKTVKLWFRKIVTQAFVEKTPNTLFLHKRRKIILYDQNVWKEVCIVLSKESLRRPSGLSWWLSGKESACHCRKHKFDSWVRKIPWRRKWQPTPVFLPGKSHGQRSLVGKRVRHDLMTKWQWKQKWPSGKH